METNQSDKTDYIAKTKELAESSPSSFLLLALRSSYFVNAAYMSDLHPESRSLKEDHSNAEVALGVSIREIPREFRQKFSELLTDQPEWYVSPLT